METVSGSPRPLPGLEMDLGTHRTAYKHTHSQDLLQWKDARHSQQKKQTGGLRGLRGITFQLPRVSLLLAEFQRTCLIPPAKNSTWLLGKLTGDSLPGESSHIVLFAWYVTILRVSEGKHMFGKNHVVCAHNFGIVRSSNGGNVPQIQVPNFSQWPNFQASLFRISNLRPTIGFPAGISGKEPTCQCRRHKRHGFDPWVRKIPWKMAWQPTPVFLPGESHGQRSWAGFGS